MQTHKRRFVNKHSLAFMLLRAGADVSHLFAERPHMAHRRTAVKRIRLLSRW